MKRFLAASLFVLGGSMAFAAASELYGKPLRGLSAVPVTAIVAHPADYEGKTIRVAGANKGDRGRPALAEGAAVLPLTTDGFSLPEDLANAQLTAEGQVRRDGKGASSVSFVATGVEVRR